MRNSLKTVISLAACLSLSACGSGAAALFMAADRIGTPRDHSREEPCTLHILRQENGNSLVESLYPKSRNATPFWVKGSTPVSGSTCIGVSPGGWMQGIPAPVVGDNDITLWDASGQKRLQGSYRNSRREGLWHTWYPDGKKDMEVEFRDGKEMGTRNTWYPSGQKHTESHYEMRDGHLQGKSVFWQENKDRNTLQESYRESEIAYRNGVKWKTTRSYDWDGKLILQEIEKDDKMVERRTY